MLAIWAELLPLFVVRLLARRCELFDLEHNGKWRQPRPGVLIYAPPERVQEEG